MGDVDDPRGGDLPLYSYDTNMGTLEPHPSPVAVHARGSSVSSCARTTARRHWSSPSDDLDFRPGSCCYRRLHARSRAHHEQSDVRGMTPEPPIAEVSGARPQVTHR